MLIPITTAMHTSPNHVMPLLSGSFHVGTSCHDIQSTQGATRSGIYLIHPPNLVQGPWKVFCDLESEGGGWTVFQVSSCSCCSCSCSCGVEQVGLSSSFVYLILAIQRCQLPCILYLVYWNREWMAILCLWSQLLCGLAYSSRPQ